MEDWSWLLGPNAEDEEFVLRQINAGRIDLVGKPATGREFLLLKEVDRMPDETLNLDEAVKQAGEGIETPAVSVETPVEAGNETSTETAQSSVAVKEQPQESIETEKAISKAAQEAVKNALKALLPFKSELTAQMDALSELVGYPAIGEASPATAAVKGLDEILKSTSLSANEQEHLVSLVKSESIRKEQIVIADKQRLNDALEKAQNEREDIKKELIAEQTIRKHVEETKRVETSLKHLPGKADETATLLMEAKAGMSADGYANLEKLFKSTDAIIKKGSFLKTLGSTVAIEGSPEAELASEVKKAMEADPKANEDVVRAGILKTNSGLYARLSPAVKQE